MKEIEAFPPRTHKVMPSRYCDIRTQAKPKTSTVDDVDSDYVAVPTDDESDDVEKFAIDDSAEEDYGGSHGLGEAPAGSEQPSKSTKFAEGFRASTKGIVTKVGRIGDADGDSPAVLEM